jgi:hypothetical protein
VRERTVHAEDFGAAWPLSVREGVLRKYQRGMVEAVTFTAEGTTYALNGAAKSFDLGADIDSIWLVDPELDPALKLKKNIGPLVDAALALGASTDQAEHTDQEDSGEVVLSPESSVAPRILREFLYVDTDKVRSLLAQLADGVPEQRSLTDKTHATSGIGLKAIVSHDRDWGSEDTVQRSLADAVFPALEELLEAEGFLTDLSAELQSEAYWTSRSFRNQIGPGSFIRITAPAHLFDARFVARSFSAFAASIGGFLEMFPQHVQVPLKGGKPQPRGQRRSQQVIEAQLEDTIADFPKAAFMEDVDATTLRSIVKLTRGIFLPGLHLISTPAGEGGPTVSARLQEGMRFLESDAEILFARYGMEPQEWTLVGTVGSFGTEQESSVANFMNASGTAIDRAQMVKSINTVISQLGDVGFVDRPSFPSFTLVPFAVYRSILPHA